MWEIIINRFKFCNMVKNFLERNYYILIFLIPFIEFYNFNKFEFSKEISFFFLFYIFIFLTFIIFFFILFEFLLRKNFPFTKLFLSYSFFLLFRHNFFEEKIFFVTENLAGEISFFVIFFVLVLLYKLQRFSSIIQLIKNFFLFYFFLVFLQLIFNMFYFKSYNKYDLDEKNKFIVEEIINNSSDVKKNMYYVVVDAMTSIKEYKNYYPNSKNTIEDFEKFIENYELNYFDGLSAYSSTRISFHSMLHLDYKFTSSSSSRQILDYSKLYPETMRENSINQYMLFDILNSLDYKILWEGSPFPGTCNQFNLNLCIEKNLSFLKNFFYKFVLNSYVLKTFLYNTPIDELYYRLGIKEYFNKNIYSEYEENDAIGKFIDKTKNNFDFSNGPYLFLIHHLSPHKPYLYNADCSKRDTKNDDLNELNELYHEGYNQAYQCVLKKIKKLIKYINDKDEDGIIVIQGDHGADFGFSVKEKELNALNAFNLFKLNNASCETSDLNDKVDMINNARFVLGCALGIKLKLLEKRVYMRLNYEKNNEKNVRLLRIK